MFFFKKSPFLAYIYTIIFFQIILESLPISSSGHIKLFEILNQKFSFLPAYNLEGFGINFEVLHLPTIFIIFIFFFSNIKKSISFSFKSLDNFFIVSRFLFTTSFLTFLFYLLIKRYNLLNIPLYLGFFLTFIILISLFFCKSGNKLFNWGLKDAFIIGVSQGISILGGISRFGSVFAASRWLGYSNKDSFYLSFLVEWPLIIAGVIKGILRLYIDCDLINLFEFDYNLLFILFFASFISYECLLLINKIVEKDKIWLISFYVLVPAFISLYLGV